MTLIRLIVILTTILSIALSSIRSQTATICPNDCFCYLDSRGRSVVECKQGGMIGPLLFINMSTNMEVLKITAPEDNMNKLSMNPNVQNYKLLEEIHITRSNIPNIGERFFAGLTKLEVLNLSQNNVMQTLPENFRGLDKLKELYLDENLIHSLPSETFRYLKELRVLSVQKNRVKEMITGVFRGLNKLRVLKLNGNSIKKFNAEIFKDAKDLRVLECRGCQLSVINAQVYTYLHHITHVDLGENQIKQVHPKDFTEATQLKVLKLDNNQLSSLPKDLLSNHTNLKALTFAKNSITTIDENAFFNLANLSELDLGYNKLEHIFSEVLRPVEETIERLVLSGNRVPLREIMAVLKNIQLLDLQLADAGIGYIDEVFAPDSVTVLNLAGNQLFSLTSSVLPNNLKDLDLTRNMFRGLDADVLDMIEGIRFKLDNNPWSCDLCHIIPMLERVNRSATIFNVRCAFPYHHANKLLGTLVREQLSWCSVAGYSSEGVNFFLGRDEGQLGIIAAGASVLLLAITVIAIFGALCYSKRHAARYYTHEEKRHDECSSIFDNSSPLFGEELSFKFPLENGDKKITIATIDEIKWENVLSKGS